MRGLGSLWKASKSINGAGLIIPLWIKVIIFLILISLVVTQIYLYGQKQFSLGEKAEKALWLSRANTELTDANNKITELQEKYRKQEQLNTQAMADKDAQLLKELQNVKSTKNTIIADLRANNLKLRIPITATTSQTCGNITTETSASTSISHGETRAELSQEASEFLVNLASECDEVALQLTAAQDIITADRVVAP
jgi:hypothetical protein